MAVDYGRLLAELTAESRGLIAVLEALPAESWQLATPAKGWTITDQVSHLAYFDDAARAAIETPAEFRAQADELISGGMDFPDRIAAEYHDMPPDELRAWFIRSRSAMLATMTETGPKTRVPWYGPEMSSASSATARLMETWAHGQDIYDALGVAHPQSLALRSIAHLGISTFAFTHRNNGLEVPVEPVRVELTAPDGELWAWGPESAGNRVRGTATDFVFVVTQRRNLNDTGLEVTGDVAAAWMAIAQAFAGAPGSGRAPLQEQ